MRLFWKVGINAPFPIAFPGGAGPPGDAINNNNNTMAVDYILSSTVHGGALKYAKENNSCLGSLANVACEVVREDGAPVGAGRGAARLPNVYTFQQVICIVRRETISAQFPPCSIAEIR